MANQSYDKDEDFLNILQKNINKSVDEFGNIIIEFLGLNSDAYQGLFYILKYDRIEVIGRYANNFNNSFEIGEGLVGQAVISKEVFVFKNTVNQTKPNNKTKTIAVITPKSAIIIPLVFNNEVYGVLELTFINNITDLQQEFLERAAINLGATLSSVINNERNKELLELSNEKTAKLEAAEKKMKKHMNKMKNISLILEKQQKSLKIEHKKIEESIKFAKNIQTAFLPTEEEVKNIFNNSFTLYMPKDIVSGDFYWISEFVDCKLVAIIDCTGHGVPGAFLSIVAHNILHEMIHYNKIKNPASILEAMHRGIKTNLKQNKIESNLGMDMSVCTFYPSENESTKVKFSGAKHFILIAHTDKDMEQVSGDRYSIGGTHSKDAYDFTLHERELSKDSMVYMLTDGYLDQPNKKRRSFSKKRLISILKTIKNFSAEEQKEKLETHLKIYAEGEKQRDDITMFGVKV